MSGDSLSFNKRVLYAGLSRMTDDRMIIQKAYSHWLQNHASQPFDVVEVVSQLVSYLGLDVNEKKALMVALHAASSKLHDDLLPVPQFIDEDSGGGMVNGADDSADKTKQEVMSSAHALVTTEYLQQFVKHIEKQSPKSISELKGMLSSEDEVSTMPKELRPVVIEWASSGLGNISLPIGISPGNCKELAHQYYLFVCEVIGPVMADDIVNKVIVDAQRLDAASQFNPRELL